LRRVVWKGMGFSPPDVAGRLGQATYHNGEDVRHTSQPLPSRICNGSDPLRSCPNHTDSALGPPASRGCGLAFLRSLPNSVPERLLRKTLAFCNALPGAIEQRLKSRGTAQQQPLQVIVVERDQQYGDRFAIPRDDQGPLGTTFVQV